MNPSHINQGKLKVKFIRYIPRNMKMIPIKRFQERNFKKGYAKIIEIPIKWSIPNITKPSRKKIQVIKVIINPHENTVEPLG